MCGKIGLLAIFPPHFAVAGRRRRGLGRRNPRPGAFRSGEPGGPGCQKPDFSAHKGARSGAAGTRPARWSRRPCAAVPRRGGWANVDECGRGGGREGADAGAAGWGAGCGGADQRIVILSERSAPKDPRGDSGMRCGWCRTGSFDCGGSRRARFCRIDGVSDGSSGAVWAAFRVRRRGFRNTVPSARVYSCRCGLGARLFSRRARRARGPVLRRSPPPALAHRLACGGSSRTSPRSR